MTVALADGVGPGLSLGDGVGVGVDGSADGVVETLAEPPAVGGAGRTVRSGKGSGSRPAGPSEELLAVEPVALSAGLGVAVTLGD